jgi:hypothetical protein
MRALFQALLGAMLFATGASAQDLQPAPRSTQAPRVEGRAVPLPPAAFVYNVIEVVTNGGAIGAQQTATATCPEGQRAYSAGFSGLVAEPIYGETVETPPTTIFGTRVPGTGGTGRAISGYRDREVPLTAVASEPAHDGRSWSVRAVYTNQVANHPAAGLVEGGWRLRLRVVCANPPG